MKPKNFQRLKQPTPVELRDACLDFLRRKFYSFPGSEKAFFQQRNDLLRRVVLYPATWLNKRGVTIHGDAYRELFMKVFMQAAAHGVDKVKYPPAYLAAVIQNHLRHHGEEYYEEAKSVRNLVENTMLLLGKAAPAAPDPVRELAAARDILAASKTKRTPIKGSLTSQLNLFN